MAKLRKRSRGQPARMYERADSALLIEQNFHPLLEMVIAAKSLKDQGKDSEFIKACDTVARYFWPHAQHKQEVDVNVTHDFIINLAEAHGNPIAPIEATPAGNVEGDEEV